MTLKQFTTAGKQARPAAVPGGTGLPDVPFVLDGDQYLMKAPKDTQLAVLVGMTSEAKTDADRVVALLDFFEATLAQPGRGRFKRRMLDPNDPLELDTLLEVFNYALETWSGTAPTSPSA